MTENCGYCTAISELRAAEEAPQESPEQLFERRYQSMRSTQLEAEQPTFDTDADESLRALAEHRRTVTADLEAYEPPDPYAKEGTR